MLAVLDAVMGLHRSSGEGGCTPIDDETGSPTLSRAQASEMEDSRGALCRNRRLIGTLERLRCGWARQDREGGEGRERAGSSCLFLQGTWRSGESDWA